MLSKFVRLAAATVVALAALSTSTASVAQPAQPQQTFRPDDVIPLDSAVRAATLPNGLKVFVRHNERPAKRISLRLAVKAGSIDEADDQRGLAHLIEHMAFNGSAHFKSGEIFSYFESVGARLGPHVNAYTSFDETVYMLELPTDKPEVVSKGLMALADFAGGLTLDPADVDKERGVVIEEWRGGLGAGSRVRDKQFPVLFYHSRYAERLPIGQPDIIRNAPAARLRAFYDTWYRPERMALVAVGDLDVPQLEREIQTDFGPLAARAPAAAEPDKTVPLHQELLVNVTTDPEVTQSSVSILRKRPRKIEVRVADWRRDVVERLVDHMLDERFGDIAQKPEAKFLAAGANSGTLSAAVETFSLGARVQDGKLQDGLNALAIEARRAKQFGFGPAELDRGKKWLAAFLERAYTERDKTESGSFAQEYLDYFLEGQPSPGIAYEYRLGQQMLPGITTADASAVANVLLADASRVVLATAPQKADVRVPSEADLRAAIVSGDTAEVAAWSEATSTRPLIETKPAVASVTSRRELPAVGVTIVRFANGVEAWLKPTDFKNDQVLFSMEASGGASLAPPADFPEATLATSYVDLAGVGGLKELDLEKLMAGKLASAEPFVSLSSHGISGSAAPAELETALQLLYEEFTAPNDDLDAFALLKRRLTAAVANRGQSPQQVFGERVALMNSSNHYTAKPLTPERVASLDREKMNAFYRARFSNAADFTVFMVGAFKIDDVVPLLGRYVGSLPSKGSATSKFNDVAIHFPEASERVRVEKGREPRGQTVISFFADPTPNPVEQENVVAAMTVLETALRDVLREELGQTYTVGVGLSQPLPQRGAGHIDVRFGSAPENVASMTDRVVREIKRLQENPPSADLTNRAKESARRGYETALKDNGYWLRRLITVHMLGGDPADILTRNERIDAVTPTTLQDVFKRYFPFDRYTVATLVPATSQ
jgi:zinc protease